MAMDYPNVDASSINYVDTPQQPQQVFPAQNTYYYPAPPVVQPQDSAYYPSVAPMDSVQYGDHHHHHQSDDATGLIILNVVILIVGCFFPIVWCGGFCFLCSKNKTVQIIAIVNVILAVFVFVIVALLIGVALLLLIFGAVIFGVAYSNIDGYWIYDYYWAPIYTYYYSNIYFYFN